MRKTLTSLVAIGVLALSGCVTLKYDRRVNPDPEQSTQESRVITSTGIAILNDLPDGSYEILSDEEASQIRGSPKPTQSDNSKRYLVPKDYR